MHDWSQYYHRRPPREHLLSRNTFFELLRSVETIWLLHITTHSDEILRQKKLYASGGCMVGSAYCVPLFPSTGGLRAHNLGSYIFKHEIKQSLASRGLLNHSITPLIIKVTIPPSTPRSVVGTNYLRLGAVHLQTFGKLEHKLPKESHMRLQDKVLHQIQMAMPLLRWCHMVIHLGQTVDDEEFFKLLTETITTFPILGYFYFEVLTEYIMLFSEDARSIRLDREGELNCWGYKEFVFRAQPSLYRNFNLGNFRPSLSRIRNVVAELEAEGTVRINTIDLITYAKQRFSFLVSRCLLGDKLHASTLSDHISFMEDYVQLLPSLVGHAIDREIRRPNEYGNFHFLFDSYKARQIWRYWQQRGLILPFNGVLPKGEVGINPLPSVVTYQVYDAQAHYIDDELFIEPDRKLDVRIVPQLIHPKLSVMGVKG